MSDNEGSEVERIDLDEEPDDRFAEDDEVLIGAPSDEAEETRPEFQDELATAAEASDIAAESFEQLKARKREELGGMVLAWWEDNSLFTGLGVLGKVLDSAVDTTKSIELMFKVGLPQDILVTPVPVNLVSGPIVLSALQVLGLFEPRLRTQVEDAMRLFADAVPTPNEEELALLNEYGAKAAEIAFGQFVNDIEASGGQVLKADDLLKQPEGGDAGLN
jgi:hypothetical protein